MDPEVEAKLAPLLAQAAQRLLQKNSNEVAQQKAQEQAQDPLIQMQMKEVQIKEAEQLRKSQKDQMDAQFKAQQQEIDRARVASQTRLEEERINTDRIKAAATMQNQRQSESTRMGVDVLKQLSSQHHQETMQRNQPQPQSGQPKKPNKSKGN